MIGEKMADAGDVTGHDFRELLVFLSPDKSNNVGAGYENYVLTELQPDCNHQGKLIHCDRTVEPPIHSSKESTILIKFKNKQMAAKCISTDDNWSILVDDDDENLNCPEKSDFPVIDAVVPYTRTFIQVTTSLSHDLAIKPLLYLIESLRWKKESIRFIFIVPEKEFVSFRNQPYRDYDEQDDKVKAALAALSINQMVIPFPKDQLNLVFTVKEMRQIKNKIEEAGRDLPADLRLKKINNNKSKRKRTQSAYVTNSSADSKPSCSSQVKPQWPTVTGQTKSNTSASTAADGVSGWGAGVHQTTHGRGGRGTAGDGSSSRHQRSTTASTTCFTVYADTNSSADNKPR